MSSSYIQFENSLTCEILFFTAAVLANLTRRSLCRLVLTRDTFVLIRQLTKRYSHQLTGIMGSAHVLLWTLGCSISKSMVK